MLGTRIQALFAGGACLLAASCGPRPSALDAGADAATRVLYGYFGVELIRIDLVQPQTTAVRARLLSAEPAPTVRLRTTMTEAECALQVPDIPFCEPRCSNGATCVGEGVCAPQPTVFDLGAVSIEGLRRVDGATLSPLVPASTVFGQPTSLSIPGEQLRYPPFASGSTLQWNIAASSGLPPITMSMPTIDELRLTNSTHESAPNRPLDVRWEPPATPVPEGQRVLVSMDFTHHAGLRGAIHCETDDDGAMTIPAALVTGLHALGTAGWPALYVTRTIRRSATVAGARLVFEVKYEKEVYVTIEGLISCHEDAECPDGRRCRPNFTCAP